MVPPPPSASTPSLHAALPISTSPSARCSVTPAPTRSAPRSAPPWRPTPPAPCADRHWPPRSEEHTSELQSRGHLVCRLLLEKKKANSPNADAPRYHSILIVES